MNSGDEMCLDLRFCFRVSFFVKEVEEDELMAILAIIMIVWVVLSVTAPEHLTNIFALYVKEPLSTTPTILESPRTGGEIEKNVLIAIFGNVYQSLGDVEQATK